MHDFDYTSYCFQSKMKKSSENQEHDGILADYFAPGNKVRDFYPHHPIPSFSQETPMKPSQIPNRYPPVFPPARRFIPFHRPEWLHQHPPRPPGHHHYSSHPSNGSAYSGDGENYHHYDHLRSYTSHQSFQRRPPSPPHLQNPHGNDQDSTERTTHSHYKSDPREKAPADPLRTDHTEHCTNKQSPLNGMERESVPLQRLDSWSPSSSQEQTPIKNQCRRASFPPADSSISTKNQTHQLTISNEDSHTKDTNPFLLKRRRDSISDDEDNSKKLFLKTPLPDRTLQSPTANVPNPSSSSSQRPQSDLELTPKTFDNHSQTLESVNHFPLPSHGTKSCPKRTPMGAKQACIKSMRDNLVVLLSPTRVSEKIEEETMQKCNSKPSPTRSVSITCPNDHKSPVNTQQTSDNKIVDSNKQKPVTKQNSNPPSCRKLHRNRKPIIADDIQDLFTPDPTTYVVHKTPKVKVEKHIKDVIDTSPLSSSVSSNPQTANLKFCTKEKNETTASEATAAVPGVKISLPNIILTRVPLPPMYAKELGEQQESRTAAQSQDKDSLDLDLDLNLDLDLEVVSVSSSDSEDQQLVSLKEIMTKKDKPERDKPERRDISKASTSRHGQHNKHHYPVSSTKMADYKNSMDQLLKEFSASKRAKETETELLTACQEDLLKIAEYEEAEAREEPISAEQQQFLQRFSLMSNAIRDIPPGHELFDLEKFGRIFNQNTLQLRQCNTTPQSTPQKTLLWSSHSQFKLYIISGLFQEAYNCSPCPFTITRFLFKMMSVHTDKLMSDKIFQVLVDIAYIATVQRVNKGNEKFKVWVPSLADITLVLMNMGAPFVSLFPLENLQPPFTESDLLDNVYIKSESSSKREPRSFPDHNYSNIYKYLSCCLSLCPRFYSDSELLLLLTLLCTVSLESRLLLHPRVGLYPVLYKLLKNIQHWDDMMPKICKALTDLTDDHHNMCHLTQLLPHHSRGRKLRQHLSLSMISKQLDGSCLYTAKSAELQLCDLRPYLPRMNPSSLLRTIAAAAHRNHSEGEDDQTVLDQQAYYLCYSLLSLVNEATNFQCFPAHQKEPLLLLCSELERHVKCHIREGEKWLYRSKVKDLVARIYTKWQMMLQKTRPLNGKLYDYWQPLQSDAGSSQDVEEIESSEDTQGEHRNTDDDEEEIGAKMEDEEEEVIEMELDIKGTEGGCPVEEKERSTFELDSEGQTSTAQGRLCEDMDTDAGSPSVEGLSLVSQEPSTSKE